MELNQDTQSHFHLFITISLWISSNQEIKASTSITSRLSIFHLHKTKLHKNGRHSSHRLP